MKTVTITSDNFHPRARVAVRVGAYVLVSFYLRRFDCRTKKLRVRDLEVQA